MRTARSTMSARVTMALALLATAVAVPGGTSPFTTTEPAAAATPLRFVSGWIPVWSTAGLASLQASEGNELVMIDPSPFNFSVTSSTSFAMSATNSANFITVARALRSKGLPVIPALTDGMSGATEEGLATMLRNEMDVHVQAIVNRVMQGIDGIAFDGIDLDYEGFAFDDSASSWGRTSPVWTEFVKRLGAALDAQGKLLSVTVPVGVSPSTGYSVYNWRGIIPSIDRLRLMTYDFSWSVPGPVSPESWVKTTIDYVKALVLELGRDPKMVQIGVPTYGRNWATVVSGTCPGSVLQRSDPTMRTAQALAASKGATPVRHGSGEMTFSFDEQFTSTGTRLSAVAVPAGSQTAGALAVSAQRGQSVAAGSGASTAPTPPAVSTAIRMTPSFYSPIDSGGLARAKRLGLCTVRRTVFYADETTVTQRARMALDAGLGGIAIWAYGYESTALWPMLRAVGDQYGTP